MYYGGHRCNIEQEPNMLTGAAGGKEQGAVHLCVDKHF